MLPVFWTEDAEDDLIAIVEYVFERNPMASRGAIEPDV
jgi:plasmid stabilization system protein ParE